MASNARPKRLLSDRLRGMRFMKQKEEKDVREKLAAEQKAREEEMHWTLEPAGGAEDEDRGPIFITEEGYFNDPMWGRRARKTFSPKHEKEAVKKEEDMDVDGGAEAEEEEGEIVEVSRTREKGRRREGGVLKVRRGITKRDKMALHFTKRAKKEVSVAPNLHRSGVSDGICLGTPIAMLVRNKDQRSQDYDTMAGAYRPSHADAAYDAKYGIRAVAGGGRSSTTETIGRVAAGAIAKSILRAYSGVEIIGYVKRVRDVEAPEIDPMKVTMEQFEANIIRCPHVETAENIIRLVDSIKKSGSSVGGVVEVIARNVPAGLGAPVFDKLEADLTRACMSLPASKGFEIGSGFGGTMLTGLEHNDEFYVDEDGRTRTVSNRSGGIQGGISNGEPIVLRVAFKPTSTIGKKQKTVTRSGEETSLMGKGRHDPCVLPRAVPMVEAMVALVLADHVMQQVAQCSLIPLTEESPNALGPKPISGSVLAGQQL